MPDTRKGHQACPWWRFRHECDILPQAFARGFQRSPVGFTASLHRSFTCANMKAQARAFCSTVLTFPEPQGSFLVCCSSPNMVLVEWQKKERCTVFSAVTFLPLALRQRPTESACQPCCRRAPRYLHRANRAAIPRAPPRRVQRSPGGDCQAIDESSSVISYS